MLAGLVCGERRTLTWAVECSGSASGSTRLAPLGWAGTLVVYCCVDFVSMPVGIAFTVGGNVGGEDVSASNPSHGGGFYSDFWGGAFPIDVSHHEPGSGAGHGEFEWAGLDLYMDGSGTWLVRWQGATATIEGTTVWSTGAGEAPCPRQPAPSAVPMVGMYAQLEAAGIAPVVPSVAFGDGPSGFSPDEDGRAYSADASASATCAFSGPSGSASWSVDATGHTDSSAGATVATNTVRVGKRWLVPSWERGFVRMSDRCLALGERLALPRVRRADVDLTATYTGVLPPPGEPGGGSTTGGTTYVELLPQMGPFLERLGDEPGDTLLEEPFGFDVPVPYSDVTTVQRLYNTSGGAPNGSDSHTFGSRIMGDDCVPPGQCNPAYDHAYWGFRLYNTWMHLGWQYGLPCYEGDDGWQPETKDGYYDPNKLQAVAHEDLPASSDAGKLAFLTSSPAGQDGLEPLWTQTIGAPHPLGITQFEVDAFEGAPTSIALDERTAPRWAFAGSGAIGDASGSGSVGASGVTVASGTTVDFALGSWTVWPYMVPHRCNGLALAALRPGVSKVEAFLVDLFGSAILIGEAAGAHAIPRGPTARGGGSWGHDAGGGDLADTFAGASATDASLAVAASAEASACYPVLPFGGGAFVRFVLHRAEGHEGPLELGFPTFSAPSWSSLRAYAHTAAFAALLGPHAPPLNFGAAQHWDPLDDAVVNPPFGSRAAILYAPSLADGTIFGNLWIRAAPWDDGLGDGYDVYEWASAPVQLVRHVEDGARVLDTHSFVAQGGSGPVVCRCSSFRAAVPPMGMFPVRRRTKASDWNAEGAYCMSQYVHFPPQRPHVAASRPELQKPFGTDRLATDEAAPSGWAVRSWEPAVDHAEGYAHSAVSGGKARARVRTRRGFVWWQGQPIGGRSPALMIWPHGPALAVWADPDGALSAHWTTGPLPRPWDGEAEIGVEAGCARPRLAHVPDETQRVLLAYDRDSRGRSRHSDDDGRTWSAEEDLPMGYRFPDVASGPAGILETAVVGSSAPYGLKIRLTPPSGAPGEWKDAKLAGGASLQLAEGGWGGVRLGRSEDEPWILLVVPDGAEDPVRFYLHDDHTLRTT